MVGALCALIFMLSEPIASGPSLTSSSSSLAQPRAHLTSWPTILQWHAGCCSASPVAVGCDTARTCTSIRSEPLRSRNSDVTSRPVDDDDLGFTAAQILSDRALVRMAAWRSAASCSVVQLSRTMSGAVPLTTLATLLLARPGGARASHVHPRGWPALVVILTSMPRVRAFSLPESLPDCSGRPAPLPYGRCGQL